jgi:hypothetical protein
VRTGDLGVEICQAGCARPRAGQPARVGGRELAQERLAVGAGLITLTSGLRAVTRSLVAPGGGPDPDLGRERTIGSDARAVVCGAPDGCLGGVAGRQLAVPLRGRSVARCRSEIASVRSCVICGGGIHARGSGQVPLCGAAIAQLPRIAMNVRVTAVHEVAVAGRLITVAR